jgi:5-formyltetrahydrofolate cyclo-ligase
LASREGIDKKSKPVPMASRIKIDLVVIGSVAVDRFGRRIGKGEGFADLEFAMGASHHGAVSADTVVITTVHDIQVFDELPPKLFEAHDLPVDVIVTPTEV